MKDIYLYKGCDELNHPDDLPDQQLELTDLVLLQQLPEFSTGFLGLNLSADKARSLLMFLGRAGARGLYVPVAYREPQVTRLAAQALAEQAAAQKQAEAFPGDAFTPVSFVEEEAMWWVFFTSSPQLADRGHIPGGFYVYIDKLDGHVCSSEELDRAFAILEEMQYQE